MKHGRDLVRLRDGKAESCEAQICTGITLHSRGEV